MQGNILNIVNSFTPIKEEFTYFWNRRTTKRAGCWGLARVM